jgi:hypothetical protein
MTQNSNKGALDAVPDCSTDANCYNNGVGPNPLELKLCFDRRKSRVLDEDFKCAKRPLLFPRYFYVAAKPC